MMQSRLTGLVLLCLFLAVMACSSDNTPVSPGIQPEVINAADNFQFQVTSMKNYSGTLVYTWENTGTMAKTNHSSTVTAGTATLVLVDGASAQVYSENLAQNGDFFSNAGSNGNWKVRVVLSHATGTLNFRVDKHTP